MKFKNYEDYRAQRESLCNAADELLQNGDVEGANARMEEVEQLDNAYEAFATAQANLAAMQGRGTAHPDGVVGSTGSTAGKDVFDTDEYKNAFMNLVCRGEALPIKYKDAIAERCNYDNRDHSGDSNNRGKGVYQRAESAWRAVCESKKNKRTGRRGNPYPVPVSYGKLGCGRLCIHRPEGNCQQKGILQLLRSGMQNRTEPDCKCG